MDLSRQAGVGFGAGVEGGEQEREVGGGEDPGERDDGGAEADGEGEDEEGGGAGVEAGGGAGEDVV